MGPAFFFFSYFLCCQLNFLKDFARFRAWRTCEHTARPARNKNKMVRIWTIRTPAGWAWAPAFVGTRLYCRMGGCFGPFVVLHDKNLWISFPSIMFCHLCIPLFLHPSNVCAWSRNQSQKSLIPFRQSNIIMHGCHFRASDARRWTQQIFLWPTP